MLDALSSPCFMTGTSTKAPLMLQDCHTLMKAVDFLCACTWHPKSQIMVNAFILMCAANAEKACAPTFSPDNMQVTA
jgi:hypothetical protein